MKKFTYMSTLTAALVAILSGLVAVNAQAQLVTVTADGAPATNPRAARAFDQMRAAIVERIMEEEPQGSQLLISGFDLAQAPDAIRFCQDQTMATRVATVSYRSQSNATLRRVAFDVCVPESAQRSAIMVQAKPDTFQNIEEPGSVRFVSLSPLTFSDGNGDCSFNNRNTPATVEACTSDPSFEIVGVGAASASGNHGHGVLSVSRSARAHCVRVTYWMAGNGYNEVFGRRTDCRGSASIHVSIPVQGIVRTAR